MNLITIAIPTYNNGSIISKAIDSCLNQTDLEDVEVLVVNNASKDNTAEVLQSYGQKIRVVTNSETVSLFENHNVAIRNSNSRYVLFCHSDDTLACDAIHILKKKIAERGHPSRYITWGHSMFRDFYPKLTNCGYASGQVFAGLYATTPFLNGGLTPSGTCYSKDFLTIGGFLPTQHRLAPSDASSMVNAALNGFKFEMMQNLLFFRTSASTLTRSTSHREADSGFENAFQNLIPMIDSATLHDIVISTGIMKAAPIRFLKVASSAHPKLVLKVLIKRAISSPRILLSYLFYISVYRALRNRAIKVKD